MNQKGLFVSFEGISGSGKTALVNTVWERLRNSESGRQLTRLVDCEGDDTAERIAELRDNEPLSPLSRLLLDCAARIQFVGSVVVPLIASGGIVLCDEYHDAGYARSANDVGEQMARAMRSRSVGDCLPDLTFLLDIDAQALMLRNPTGPTKALDLQEKTRQALRVIAWEAPARVCMLDAELPPETLAEIAWERLVFTARSHGIDIMPKPAETTGDAASGGTATGEPGEASATPGSAAREDGA